MTGPPSDVNKHRVTGRPDGDFGNGMEDRVPSEQNRDGSDHRLLKIV